MKYLLLLLIAACSSGGGSGGGESCGPNALSGVFHDNNETEFVSVSNCHFTYHNDAHCVIQGSYPYSGAAQGTMTVTVESYGGACIPPSHVSECQYQVFSNALDLNCPGLGINDRFYK